MASAAHSQRNAAEILGQAVKPPERIAIGSRGMASQLPRDYSLPGLRQSRRRDNLPATAGRHRDQSSPSPGRHQGDRHTKLRSRGRARTRRGKQDCRSRFPDPESLAGLTGVAPVTRRSGTRISHGFRWAVNRQLRDAVCDFADDSRHASPWAAAIYDEARARGKDHPHAVRITARAWIYVIWRCWQDSVAYDPDKHNALQNILARQQAGGAAAAGPADTR